MDDVETTVVALTMSDDTDTTHVTTTSDHSNGTSVELDGVGDLASGEIDLDGVVDLNQRVRVANAVVEDITLAIGLEGKTHTSHRGSKLSTGVDSTTHDESLAVVPP